eukprot:m51a1_g12191 hypothetical protein (241) ;mRNA; f:21244-22734
MSGSNNGSWPPPPKRPRTANLFYGVNINAININNVFCGPPPPPAVGPLPAAAGLVVPAAPFVPPLAAPAAAAAAPAASAPSHPVAAPLAPSAPVVASSVAPAAAVAAPCAPVSAPSVASAPSASAAPLAVSSVVAPAPVVARPEEAVEAAAQDVEHENICPITLAVPVHPVRAPDGHVYERDSIVQWLQRTPRSPLTNQCMTIEDLVPLRGAIANGDRAIDDVLDESVASLASAGADGAS